MEKKITSRAKKEKVIIPELNEKEQYLFHFNEKCPEKELHNQKHYLTGELVKIFLSQGYGILC